MALLEIDGLGIDVAGARAVEAVSLAVEAGETLALVGESGCGKTLTALSILRLLPPAARVAAGTIRFEGRDLLGLSEEELRAVRGGRIGMVFQDPSAALHPSLTVGEQVGEGLRAHRGLSRAAAAAQAVLLLRRVGIPDPEARARSCPHAFSGGMRQRVLIAMALACEPALLVCDEPTAALDVTISAQILALLADLRSERSLAMLLVSHDLALVRGAADRVAVMYAGQLAEVGPAAEVLSRPRHPYTAGLLRARAPAGPRRLAVIPGQVPALLAMPSGCRFRDRCERAQPDCAAVPPRVAQGARSLACFHPLEDAA